MKIAAGNDGLSDVIAPESYILTTRSQLSPLYTVFELCFIILFFAYVQVFLPMQIVGM